MSVERLPQRFESVAALEDFMTEPTPVLVDDLASVPGDILVLGAAGKMGPTLARMAKRGMMFFLAVASNIFGAIFTRLGSAKLMTDTLIGLSLPPMGTLLVVMFLIFLLGWPFEWPTIVFVFVPLFQPAIMALNYDPLWFAVLVAVNFQTTFLSPPLATAAYYLKAVAPDWTLTDIHWGMAEFMVLQLSVCCWSSCFPPSPCGSRTGCTGSERVACRYRACNDGLDRRPQVRPSDARTCCAPAEGVRWNVCKTSRITLICSTSASGRSTPLDTTSSRLAREPRRSASSGRHRSRSSSPT